MRSRLGLTLVLVSCKGTLQYANGDIYSGGGTQLSSNSHGLRLHNPQGYWKGGKKHGSGTCRLHVTLEGCRNE